MTIPLNSHRIPSRQRLRFETLLADISARFVNISPTQVDQEIGIGQRLICEALDLDHSSVWQLAGHGDSAEMLLTHFYRDPKLPPLPMQVNARDYFPWALGRVLMNEIVCLRNLADLPSEAVRDRLSHQQFGIKAGLAIPLSIGGHPPMGALSFESTKGERDWPESLKKRLQLLAQVFANALDRRRTDQELVESEARLTLAAHVAGAGLWTLDVSSGMVWMSATTSKLFGLQPDEQVNYEKFLRMIHPEDSEAVRRIVSEAMQSGEELAVEYRVIRPDGSVRWMASRGRRHSYTPGGPLILMGLTVDINESRRAEQERLGFSRRLFEAQEAERRLIARELHDDIGQLLSILNIRLGNATDRLSSSPSESIAELSRISADLAAISSRISQISHQIHSIEVETFGLERAAKILCEGWSARHRIPVEFIPDQIPDDIQNTVAVCFYRILQEALHNISKHGEAGHVEVRWTGSGDELTLSITDDGHGFDVEKVRGSAGLGLISMRERIEIIGGEFKIASNPGEGTRIRVRGPIKTRA